MKRNREDMSGGGPPNQPSKRPAPSQQSAASMPKVQDALGYLDKVKQRFITQPAVYNHFLDIMKDFKSMTIDTEGVIKRVKTLFKGHRSLILGFNQFLPPGYKIELDDPAVLPIQPVQPQHMIQSVGNMVTPSMNSNAMSGLSSSITSSPHSHPQNSQHQHQQQNNNNNNNNNPNNTNNQSAANLMAKPIKPTVEFNHAVQYVAKIKLRFRDQPETYAEFLDILHDYQAKRTIDEVYQRVQRLFAGQPDLLNEFRYFLPDNNAQASGGQLGDMGKKSGSGQSAMKPKQSSLSQKSSSGGQGFSGKKDKSDLSKSARNSLGSNNTSSKLKKVLPGGKKDKNDKDASGKKFKSDRDRGDRDGRGDRNEKSIVHGGTVIKTVMFPPGSEAALTMFDRFRQYCHKSQWLLTLKALNLFALDIITRAELIRMLEDILSDGRGIRFLQSQVSTGYGSSSVSSLGGTCEAALDLLDRFKTAIEYSDDSDEKRVNSAIGLSSSLSGTHQTNYYAFINSAELTAPSAQTTPSYRMLPPNVALPHCSGRTALCDEVLNDVCVSIPTGSEDYSFKSTRKNQYEEQLFKVEDERFELDMMIENNAAAIRVLEPVVEQSSHMSMEEQKRLRIGEYLDILHIRAIARIYGESGYEMIEHLRQHPAIAAKVILDRLHQKDEEWRRVRGEMKNVWRKITESNYQRSLDHRSFYFKQEDKKRRAPKALVSELREVHQRVFQSSDDIDKDDIFSGLRPGIEESIMLRQIRQGHRINPLYTYCMVFTFNDAEIHKQMYQLICNVAKRTLTDLDMARMTVFWIGFVWDYFAVEGRDEERKVVDARLREEEAKKRSPASVDVMFEEKKAEPEMTDDAADAAMDEDDDGAATGTGGAAGDAGGVSESKRGARRRGGKRGGKRVTKKVQIMNKPVERAAPTLAGEESDDAGGDGEPEVETDSVKKMNKPTMRGKADRDDIDEIDTAEDSHETDAVRSGGGLLPSTSSLTDITACIAECSSLPASALTSSLKPLRLSMECWALEESLAPVRRHTRPSRLFFGSNAYYVFLRLYQFLYERLLTAKQLALKQRKVNTKKLKVLSTGDERYARFTQLVSELLDSTVTGAAVDTNKFEDECRNLLGASSYTLFTIDKLIAQLVKQCVALVNSEVSVQLLSLYQYETRRAKVSVHTQGNSEALSAVLCRMYYSNAMAILADDNCVQMEYFYDVQQLGMGLIDGLALNETKSVPEEWSKYLDTYIHTSAAAAAQSVDELPMLKRNLRRVVNSFGKPKDHAALANATMKSVYNSSGLEVKIELRSYKLIFVEDTADVFIRFDRPVRPAHTDANGDSYRVRRALAWCQRRFIELNPLYEEAPADDGDADDLAADEDLDMVAMAAAGSDVDNELDGRGSPAPSASPIPPDTVDFSRALSDAVSAAQMSMNEEDNEERDNDNEQEHDADADADTMEDQDGDGDADADADADVDGDGDVDADDQQHPSSSPSSSPLQ